MIPRLFLLALLIPPTFTILAQADMDILEKAQDLAAREQYEPALQKIDSGLSLYPDHHDLLAYKVRVLMWDGQFDLAAENIGRLLELNPRDQESVDLQLTLFLWREKWTSLLLQAEKAIDMHPDHEPFRTFKARALIGLNEFKKARAVLAKINDPQARKLEKELFLNSHHLVRINGSHSRFSTGFSPWTLLSAGLGNVGKHSWDLTTSYGRLFDQSGVRVSASAYPSLAPELSAFLEAGYSPSPIFPRMELGAELLKAIGTVEVGGGLKYFRFHETGNAFIYKGVAACYFGENYASYRIYYSSMAENPSATHLISIRHFFGNRYRYIQLLGSLGSTPVQVNSPQEIKRLDAQALIASLKYLPDDSKWLLDVEVGVQNEIYLENQKRQRFTTIIGISRLW